jgi:2-succinyl-5-enolpyruvyl-6-hydroxy-3-cyclohexene-1-carboxylate synthase
VGVPTGQPSEQAYVRALVGRALAAAIGAPEGRPGPVHLNLAFAEPLVPFPMGLPGATPSGEVDVDGRPQDAPWVAVAGRRRHQAPPADGWPARSLVVVGDGDAEAGAQAVALAEARGWPVVAEPSSGARRGPNALRVGHLVLGVEPWLQDRLPERVLVVGRPTLHRQVAALLRRPQVRVEVVAAGGWWADAGRRAAAVLAAVPEQGSHRPEVDPAWLDAWRSADAAAAEALEAAVDPADGPTGADVAAAVVAGLRPGSLLVVGSSMPVRDLALAPPRDGVTVLANRGAAGIDGTVSTAMGAALAWQAAGGGPACALLGDLTFLHDANGLLLGPDEPRPDLALVVVNNDGGAIFSLLEQGSEAFAGPYERVFGTPHGTDLAALCGASGTAYTRVSTTAELVAAATDPRAGLQVVEIRVDRSGDRARAERVRTQVAAALIR